MALFHITIEKVIVRGNDTELLEKINRKLTLLLSSTDDNEKIAKAAADLDTSTNQLKDAVDKNKL